MASPKTNNDDLQRKMTSSRPTTSFTQQKRVTSCYTSPSSRRLQKKFGRSTPQQPRNNTGTVIYPEWIPARLATQDVELGAVGQSIPVGRADPLGEQQEDEARTKAHAEADSKRNSCHASAAVTLNTVLFFPIKV